MKRTILETAPLSARPTLALAMTALVALFAGCVTPEGGSTSASGEASGPTAGSVSASTDNSDPSSTVGTTGTDGTMTSIGTDTTATATATTTASGSATDPTDPTDPTASGSATDPTDPTGSTDSETGNTGETGDEPPPLGEDACTGYATRYWDCCKAHCGWPANVNPGTDTLASCDKDDMSHGDDFLVASSCDQPTPSSAYTCYSMTPWAVSPTLAYGFAAIPAEGDICGRCYQLDFDGTGHYNDSDPGSVALLGKTMIVQATNIGYDVGGGQFDILTPGGGVGAFDACSYQWGVETPELGATYGGFMTYCQEQVGSDHGKLKECVLSRCAAVFDDPGLAELAAGCEWYVDWYEVADNPDLRYQEVACPEAIVARSGLDRGPLDDVAKCMGGGGGGECSQEEQDACDCAWTEGGTKCGMDDGSCCWTACCGD